LAENAGVPPATRAAGAQPFDVAASISFRASRSLRAGRPRSRPITWPST